jgi:hypothetical protein
MFDKELSADGDAKLTPVVLLLVNEYCQAMEQGWTENNLDAHHRAYARGFAFGIAYAHDTLAPRYTCHMAIMHRIIMLCSPLYIR